MSKIVNRYLLLKDLPALKAGVIFEHREWDKRFPDVGNIKYGYLTNAWDAGGWCAESYLLPGQGIRDHNWFKLVSNSPASYDELVEENRLLKSQIAAIKDHLVLG